MEEELAALFAGNAYFGPMLDAARKLAREMSGPDAGISTPFNEFRTMGLLQILAALYAVCGNNAVEKMEALQKLSAFLVRFSRECLESAANLAQVDGKWATASALGSLTHDLSVIGERIGE